MLTNKVRGSAAHEQGKGVGGTPAQLNKLLASCRVKSIGHRDSNGHEATGLKGPFARGYMEVWAGPATFQQLRVIRADFVYTRTPLRNDVMVSGESWLPRSAALVRLVNRPRSRSASLRCRLLGSDWPIQSADGAIGLDRVCRWRHRHTLVCMPDDPWRKLGVTPGLCAACRHPKLNETRRGTAYLRCARAEWDSRLARYPRLPVEECEGFEQRDG